MEYVRCHAVFSEKKEQNCSKVKICKLTASWYSVFVHRFMCLYFTFYCCAPGVLQSEVKAFVMLQYLVRFPDSIHSKVWRYAAFFFFIIPCKWERRSTSFYDYLVKKKNWIFRNKQVKRWLSNEKLSFFSLLHWNAQGLRTYSPLQGITDVFCWLTSHFI